MIRWAKQLVLILPVALVACADESATSPLPAPTPEGLSECREAADRGNELIGIVGEVVEDVTLGNPPPQDAVSARIDYEGFGEAREACGRFSDSENERVQACARAAESAGEIAMWTLRAIDAPTRDLMLLAIDASEFHLEQFAEDYALC